MRKKVLSSAAAQQIDGVVQMLGEFFNEVYGAFMKHRVSLKYQQTSGEMTSRMRQGLARFYEEAGRAKSDEALSIQSISINLSKIYYNSLRLSGLVETKVKEKILFSDEAVKEMSDLIRRTGELLPNAADALKTGNAIIISHMEKEVETLRANAVKSAAMHEDRLCKGICHPKASIIYMQMLQLLQDILWHCKALVSEQDGIPGT